MPVEPADDPQFSLFKDGTAVDEDEPPAPDAKYSSFVVFVDESGDHGLQTLDPAYPMFVLSFCVFHKRYYCEKVVPALHKFKFNHFGHDLVVLHEHEIRKEKGSFKFSGRAAKERFLNELHGVIARSNFILISCVVNKEQLRGRQAGLPPNPYHVALGFCLETLFQFLQEKGQEQLLTHIAVECRGKKEDDELELEFRRFCDGANRLGKRMPFEIIFADKKVNSVGLQLADLVARPIGLSVLRPDQPNRAFDVLKEKFFCSGGRQRVGEGYDGWGLKLFPAPESEKPR